MSEPKSNDETLEKIGLLLGHLTQKLCAVGKISATLNPKLPIILFEFYGKESRAAFFCKAEALEGIPKLGLHIYASALIDLHLGKLLDPFPT